MKYGETFQAQSVPQWAPYNLDYNELKNLIKANTTKDQGQAIAIPGQVNAALAKFEDSFYNELSNQHDRVDLFVTSKADEIGRRLEHYKRDYVRLRARCELKFDKPMSQKRRLRLAKYDQQITRCGEDIKSLQKFVQAQREAFRKILKKYRKWTGSRTLSDRFNNQVLRDPKSFTQENFETLQSRCNELIANIRAFTPDVSEASTPQPRSRQPSIRVNSASQQLPQAYWNEYDNGSDAGGEDVYTLYIDPDAESTFPGAKTMSFLISKAKIPVEKVKGWLSPPGTPNDERRPLIGNGNTPNGYFTETDVDDEAYASSSDFPAGYATHYATFPSINDQKLAREREALLFRGTVGSFVAAIFLMVVAGILVATGKRKLQTEVDAGVFAGVASSLFFDTLGLAAMLYDIDRCSLIHRLVVIFVFAAICVVNSGIMVMVIGE